MPLDDDTMWDDPLVSTKTVAGLYAPDVVAASRSLTETGDNRIDDFPDM